MLSSAMCRVARNQHALVIVLYGECNVDSISYWLKLQANGFRIVIVDNSKSERSSLFCNFSSYVHHANLSGLSGALNLAVDHILSGPHITQYITFLDQDSRISVDSLVKLNSHIHVQSSEGPILIGPSIWDKYRQAPHPDTYLPRKNLRFPALIISGSTFALRHWSSLGPLPAELRVDYIDIAWCSKIIARGHMTVKCGESRLDQVFGAKHPNYFCHCIGMQIYSPYRHYISIRDLKRFSQISEVSWSIRLAEVLKMLIKPILWILFEPKRAQNIHSVIRAIRT